MCVCVYKICCICKVRRNGRRWDFLVAIVYIMIYDGIIVNYMIVKRFVNY